MTHIQHAITNQHSLIIFDIAPSRRELYNDEGLAVAEHGVVVTLLGSHLSKLCFRMSQIKVESSELVRQQNKATLIGIPVAYHRS